MNHLPQATRDEMRRTTVALREFARIEAELDDHADQSRILALSIWDRLPPLVYWGGLAFLTGSGLAILGCILFA